MKLFKTTDEKLLELGFKKELETQYSTIYTRKNNEFNYIHEVGLYHKASGKHMMISSESAINSDNFNNAVGITAKEMKLFLKKMKELGLHKEIPK